jgi:hypothetical protein
MILTFNEDGILLHKCYIFRDVGVVIGLPVDTSRERLKGQ